MNRQELYNAAMQAKDAGVSLMLELPVGWRRPPGWPRGELMCVNSSGRAVYRVSPLRVMRWLDDTEPVRHGAAAEPAPPVVVLA